MNFSELAQRFDNAVIRFYSEPKRKVATCVMGSPAFDVEGNVAQARPISPDTQAIGGTIRFASIYLADGGVLENLPCGEVGSSAVVQVNKLQISPGEALQVEGLTLVANVDEQMTEAIRRAVRPRPSGEVSVIRKVDKDRAEAGARAQLEEQGVEITETLAERIHEMAAHGTPAGEIVEAIEEETDD